MSGIFTKLTDFVGRSPTEVIDAGGTAEIFSDVAVCQDYGETVRVQLCRYLSNGKLEAVATIFMPKGGFLRSLGWAVASFLTARRPDVH